MASDRIRRDRTKRRIIILDTSAILMPFEFPVDLFDELSRLLGDYYVLIPKLVIRELQVLAREANGRKKIFAKASLDLIKDFDVEDGNVENADDSVLFLAEKYNGIVVTNDKELRKRAKSKGLKTIFLREKSKLVID